MRRRRAPAADRSRAARPGVDRRTCPFARPPQVAAITVKQVAQIHDATGLLADEQDIPPMALAHQALEMAEPESPLDAALHRVLRQMKV